MILQNFDQILNEIMQEFEQVFEILQIIIEIELTILLVFQKRLFQICEMIGINFEKMLLSETKELKQV